MTRMAWPSDLGSGENAVTYSRLSVCLTNAFRQSDGINYLTAHGDIFLSRCRR